MELGLPGDPDRARHREGQPGLRHERGGQPGLGRRPCLGAQLVHPARVARVCVRVPGLPLAVDAQFPDDPGRALDRLGLGAGVQSRALGAAGTPQLVVDECVQGGDLGGGVPGDPGRDPPGLQYRHAPPGPGQLPRRAQSGDPGADHRHVDLQVLRQGRVVAVRCRIEPVRAADLLLLAHVSPSTPEDPLQWAGVSLYRRDRQS